MDAPAELALRHGFEAEEFPEESSEESSGREGGVVRYTHGYVDPWQTGGESGDVDESDSVALAIQGLCAPGPLELDEPVLDDEEDLAHDDEVAYWAAVGRRARRSWKAENLY